MASLQQRHPAAAPTYPNIPPSLSAGDHEMRDYYTSAQDSTSEQYDSQQQRPLLHSVQNITPYLGLRSRLSQVWINRWTVLLFLVLVRVLIAVAGLKHDLASAKTEAMSACSGVESMGSVLASMPHYLSTGVNELTAQGVEKAVHGLISILLLLVTGIEELIVFVVNMFTSTYMCLITLAVSGSFHVALQVIEDTSDFLNKTLKDISNDIGNAVNDFEGDFNKFIGALNSVPSIFGGSSGSIPKIDLSNEQQALTTLQLPSTLDQGLDKLNGSLPTFSDVQSLVDNAIRSPFEDLKTLVNGSLQYTFDRSVLPVPDKKQLTFCSDNDDISNFFADLADLINDARKIFIAVLVLLALAICIPMAYREIQRWRRIQDRVRLVDKRSFDSLDVVYITSRPFTSSAGLNISRPFSSHRRQVLSRWVIAYATSLPALLVLSLAITGLFSCLCQYILLRTLEKEVPALANEVGSFADKVVGALENASANWSEDANSAILKVNNDINNDILGWVNTSTHAVNDTLNSFINHTTATLNLTFNGTVLYDPVTEVFNCLVGLKVASFEKGLTWVSDNAKVDFPLLPNNTFSLGPAESLANVDPGNESNSFLASPGSVTTDKITNAIAKVSQYLAHQILTEVAVSLGLLAVWVSIVLLGLARAFWLAFRPSRFERRRVPAMSPDDFNTRPLGKDGNLAPGPSTSLREPAPAYEPPKDAPSTTVQNTFDDTSYGTTNYTVDVTLGENVSSDRKLSFGGLRRPVIQRDPPHRHQIRRSVHPILERFQK